MTLEGDEVFFEPRVRHLSSLRLPDLPSNLETRHEPGDGSGRMAIELQLTPAMHTGVVILRGDDPETITQLWRHMEASGSCDIPRIDSYHYGDVILESYRTTGGSSQWHQIGDPAGDIVLPPQAPVRYRYDFSPDGFLTAARAWGPDVDLMFDVSAEDTYGCQYGEETSFVDEQRRVCEEYAAEHPELVIDCDR
jgi:hypothetical protein